jgi:hypothetical protein
MTVWLALLTGGIGAAVVKLLGDLLEKFVDRKGRKDDAEQERLKKKAEEETALLHATAAGIKWVLYDRIKCLGTRYVEDGAVDFDDRRLLHEMHKVYHYGLGGNGDLDILMKTVDELPQKA